MRGPGHATGEDLDTDCYQVAGTVGRLMAPLLGIVPGREADADARSGRVYLPASALAGVGVAPNDARVLVDLPAWPAARREALLARELGRADADDAAGLASVDCLERGRPGISAAVAMYRAIPRELERDGHGASGRRAVGPRHRKVRFVAGALAGDARSARGPS